MTHTEKLLLEYLAATHELTSKLIKSLFDESVVKEQTVTNTDQKSAIIKTGNEELTLFEEWLISKANEQPKVNRHFDIDIFNNKPCIKFVRSGHIYAIPNQTNFEFMANYFNELVDRYKHKYTTEASKKVQILKEINNIKLYYCVDRTDSMIGDGLKEIFSKPINDISEIEILAYCFFEKGLVDESSFEWFYF